MLAAIEEGGHKNGLKLNKTKCEVMYTMKDANIHFKDGTRVPRKNEVKYLGCELNQQTDYNKEIGKRISVTMGIRRKLDLFWLHSSCPIRVK